MKENNIKNGIESFKKINLSSSEKETLLNNLSAYVDSNPVKNIPIKSPFVSWSMFVNIRAHAVYSATALVLIVGMGVGTTFAAEKALPGDLLYPVKIKVTEPVRGALKVTPKAREEWESKKALKRLEEAEKLVEKGNLNTKNRVDIEKEFEKNTKAFVQKNMEKVRDDKMDQIEKDKSNEDDASREQFKNDVKERLDKIAEKNEKRLEKKQKDEVDSLNKNIRERVDFRMNTEGI